MSPVMKPGWFSRNGDKYLTLSEVPRALNVTASEITDAIARGDIAVERISGCKAIPVSELFSYIEKGRFPDERQQSNRRRGCQKPTAAYGY